MSQELNPTRVAHAQKLDSDLAYAWETWADSFDVLEEIINDGYYVELGYETAIDYVREQLMPIVDKAKLTAAHRQPIVQALVSAGFSNRAIASATGVSETQIRKDKKALEGANLPNEDEDANKFASNEVDAAGQSVDPVGHIDDDSESLQIVEMRSTTREEEAQQTWNANDEPEEVVDRFAGINFDALIIPTPSAQILETKATEVTQEYFQPRQPEPSWSPPQVRELPPPAPKAYDDPQDDFLAPPMKLEKVRDPNKDDTKHCRTCACNLLP